MRLKIEDKGQEGILRYCPGSTLDSFVKYVLKKFENVNLICDLEWN
jgi:hypothetical protein